MPETVEVPFYVNASGRPLDIDLAAAKKRPKAPPKVKATTGNEWEDVASLGFVVQGLRPGALETAKVERAAAIADYPHECERARATHEPVPRQPLPWDEDAWMSSAKRAKVRSKPYEMQSAANECANLARKAGWLCVTVTEVRRARKE